MKKSVILSTLIIILFLVSCRGRVAAGDNPTTTEAALKEVQTGTQGVEIQVVPNYPPSTIYDQNQLVALVELRNRGNHDLEQQDCFVQVTGFDPNIVQGTFQTTLSCASNAGVLEGKNVYNTQGGFNQLEFSSSLSLPDGVFEYNPQLNFITCYNYHTKASPQVCVDPLFYQVTTQQKTCNPTDVSMSGGQGAPVGVSSIGVDMVGNKAIFEINVQNYGSGRVLNPNADIHSCGQMSLSYQDLDKVRYDVNLNGGNILDCKPQDHLVRLNNNQGKIVCSFTIPGGSSFQTPLLIDLDYSYIQSYLKQIKIIKTPQ